MALTNNSHIRYFCICLRQFSSLQSQTVKTVWDDASRHPSSRTHHGPHAAGRVVPGVTVQLKGEEIWCVRGCLIQSSSDTNCRSTNNPSRCLLLFLAASSAFSDPSGPPSSSSSPDQIRSPYCSLTLLPPSSLYVLYRKLFENYFTAFANFHKTVSLSKTLNAKTQTGSEIYL